MQSSLQIAILAAGQGKRMRSALPKVLQPLGGRPLLAHVLSTARKLEPRPSASSIPAARCASALPIPT
jgi:bifunctional UDP-N-acetylglucosamine pyrophosphorylase/glucosamine-1-phosphate N-acetyltransferase